MNKSLFPLSLCFLVLVVVQTTHYLPSASASASSSSDLVAETCHKTPNFQLCVSTLRSDPRSKTADVSGLGLIVVNTVKTKAASTPQRINTLIKSNPKLKTPLTQCAQLYNAVLNADVPSSIQAFRLGDPKFAESGMADAANEATSCEKAFAFAGKSPLTSVNKLVADLSLVASAIAKTLL